RLHAPSPAYGHWADPVCASGNARLSARGGLTTRRDTPAAEAAPHREMNTIGCSSMQFFDRPRCRWAEPQNPTPWILTMLPTSDMGEAPFRTPANIPSTLRSVARCGDITAPEHNVSASSVTTEELEASGSSRTTW